MGGGEEDFLKLVKISSRDMIITIFLGEFILQKQKIFLIIFIFTKVFYKSFYLYALNFKINCQKQLVFDKNQKHDSHVKK